MLKISRITLFFTLICPLFASAEIIETNRFDTINEHITEDTLILLDIDNTLIEPTQEMGTNQWFEHRIKLYAESGLSKRDALEYALSEWTAVQYMTQVKLVEPQIADIVDKLQQNYRVMGLTTRGLGLATRTVHQLESVDIDLSKATPYDTEIYFYNGEGCLYRHGILFTCGTDKAHALEQVMQSKEWKPSKIVFINDKLTHLLPIERLCAKNDVEFIGLRYNHLDDKVNNIRHDVADIQFNKFANLITDQEAEQILSETNGTHLVKQTP
ncbi:MAG: hypothetical protein S4CHLAM102_03900 [Chlamydiia bacterium]|nr:hypothetical protein [Chlamydiia bacterium]